MWRGDASSAVYSLNDIAVAFEATGQFPSKHLLLAPYFKEEMKTFSDARFLVAELRKKEELPVPAFSTLNYFYSLLLPICSANLVQAQRDYFVRTL